SDASVPDLLCLVAPTPPPSALFPYTTLFRSLVLADGTIYAGTTYAATGSVFGQLVFDTTMTGYQHSLTNPSNAVLVSGHGGVERSEEHTSELQSRFDLVCRLLLEKKKLSVRS